MLRNSTVDSLESYWTFNLISNHQNIFFLKIKTSSFHNWRKKSFWKGHWVDLCSSPPFAPSTTCRAYITGAHFHFYYQQNNPSSIEAKDILRQLTTEEFGLSLDFCPDRNGHEEPHNEVCWLSGPEGRSKLLKPIPISMNQYQRCPWLAVMWWA